MTPQEARKTPIGIIAAIIAPVLTLALFRTDLYRYSEQLLPGGGNPNAPWVDLNVPLFGLIFGKAIFAGLVTYLSLTLVASVYPTIGPIVATINIVLSVHSIFREGPEKFHVALWCDLLTFLRIHNMAAEWICALLMIIGWIQTARSVD